MAVNKCKARFVVTYLCLALLLCLVTSQTEAEVVRVRRQECQHGMYEHEERQCCNCPPGSKVKAHCTENLKMSECELCISGKEYQSHASHQTNCERCTSCAHPNANLEEDTPCTPYNDTTCKCKEKHYCPSGKTPCKVCEPCQECGPEGEKVKCSSTNNTICNDKTQENNLGVILGVTIPLLILAGAVVGLCCWKKRKSGSRNHENLEFPEENVRLQTVGKTDSVVGVRLGTHIPEVAELIGWKTMRNLAQKHNIPKGKLESCEEIPNGVERTIALLNIWEEKESKNAAPKLITYLRDVHQNDTADKVLDILSKG